MALEKLSSDLVPNFIKNRLFSTQKSKMGDKSLLKPATLKFNRKDETVIGISEVTVENEPQPEKEHGYAMEVANSTNKRVNSTPPTPNSKAPDKRIKASEGNEAVTSNKAILEANKAILEAIRDLKMSVDVQIRDFKLSVNEQLADLKEQSRQSSTMLASLTRAVDFNAEEVADCKKRVSAQEKQNAKLKKDNDALRTKMRDQERYRLRWYLRLKDLKETRGEEDVRPQVVQILGKIVPALEDKMEQAVDVAHRVGKKSENKARDVMIMFAIRRVRDEVWRQSKGSQVCMERRIRFAEVLPAEDYEERSRLWPKVDAARKAGKTAYFRGPYAYINGKKVEDDDEEDAVLVTAQGSDHRGERKTTGSDD